MAAESEEAKTWVGNMLCFFLLFSASMAIIDQGRDGSSNYQNLEIQKLSKKLNRPAVKSIKQSGSCPEETIPIRRIRKEDILRAKSIQQFGKKNLKNIPQHGSFETHSKHQFAAVYVKGDKYHGGMATMNVWNPHVQEHNEFSDCQISILNDNIGKGYNSIQAGWQVNPRLYGDNNTRFFTFWRGGSGENASRCYDLLCSGFIQVNHRVVVGAAIRPLSAYGDSKSQHAITILVWKTGNWWLQYGPNNEVVGYWPASLFPLLSESATTVGWGGEVLNLGSNGQHTTTQMESGHFAQEGYGKACFFWNIKVVNGNNQTVPPNNIRTRVDQPYCYHVQTSQSNDWGNYSFGGPGRNPSCP
ncbi:uncharacterized protein LOC114734412 [Neltuma alba]|uniref:uncharacterized protein LOC114734412 n=1 Tax=Neltuma alba TaxID=207710 RepID=UPI0010A4A9A8|nr:uncharacterized protein LOC114734412 [Prosopis alba]